MPEWEPERGAFLTVATFHMRRRVRELLGIRTTKTRIENMGTASLDVALDDENDTPLVEQIIDPAALDPEEAALQAAHCAGIRYTSAGRTKIGHRSGIFQRRRARRRSGQKSATYIAKG